MIVESMRSLRKTADAEEARAYEAQLRDRQRMIEAQEAFDRFAAQLATSAAPGSDGPELYWYWNPDQVGPENSRLHLWTDVDLLLRPL